MTIPTVFRTSNNSSDSIIRLSNETLIEHDNTNVDVKLDAGEIVVYDSGLMHQVKPVTKGVRIGYVGWLQSWIPDARMRGVLTSYL